VARRAVVGGLVAAAGLAAAAALAAPGQLDRSFGTGGTLLTDLGGLDAAASVRVAATGAVVVGGVSDGRLALARYDRAGRPDPAFGAGGKVVTELAADAGVGTLVVQGDGSVVAVGQQDGDLALARYTATGMPDASFDGDGVAVTDLGQQERGLALFPQSGGRLLLVATRSGALVLARYQRNGLLDPAFGRGGIVATRVPALEWKVAAQGPGGTIVAAGVRTTNPPRQTMTLAVARLRSDGTRDRTLDKDGVKVTKPLPGWAGALHVAVRRDGRILLGTHGHAGKSEGFALVRLRRDGSFDPTFGRRGIAVSGVGFGVHALALDRRGRIVAAGRTKSLLDFVVARYLPDGRRDRSFRATVTDFGGIDTPFWLSLQPDGKAVVVGASASQGLLGDVAVARYLSG
jgi:uncharacterized delta-60 repeat protein